MTRVLLVALVSLPAAVAAPLRPETDGETVSRVWGRIHAPPGPYRAKPEGNLLTLRTIGWATPFDFQTPQFRVTREVTGDFDARVKLYDLDAPARGVPYEGSGPQTAAGMYVDGGDSAVGLYRWKAIHHDKGVLQPGMQDSPWLVRRARNGGSGSTLGQWEAGQSGYLRIVRKGDTLTALVSRDGKEWKQYNAARDGMSLPNAVTVGLFVGHNTSQTCSATFSEFTIEKPQ